MTWSFHGLVQNDLTVLILFIIYYYCVDFRVIKHCSTSFDLDNNIKCLIMCLVYLLLPRKKKMASGSALFYLYSYFLFLSNLNSKVNLLMIT